VEVHLAKMVSAEALVVSTASSANHRPCALSRNESHHHHATLRTNFYPVYSSRCLGWNLVMLLYAGINFGMRLWFQRSLVPIEIDWPTCCVRFHALQVVSHDTSKSYPLRHSTAERAFAETRPTFWHGYGHLTGTVLRSSHLLAKSAHSPLRTPGSRQTSIAVWLTREIKHASESYW